MSSLITKPELENNESFQQLFLKVLAENWDNNYTDNFDHLRFGDNEYEFTKSQKNLFEITAYLNQLDSFFNALSDSRSKEILLQVLAFRVLGHRKVKLPLSQSIYWDAINNISKIINNDEELNVTFLNSSKKLSFFDLKNFDLPIKLYTTARTVLTQFLIKQYEYVNDNEVVIGAQLGDIVIDGGACWGDTTLLFANQVKESGKVYSFEFIPGNLNIVYKNINLNPNLKNQVKIIEKPLWNESDKRMYYMDRGPASKVSLDEFEGYENTVSTIAIDDFVEKEKLEKVDLIKMDIEGAEQYALKGAQNTIKKYKPKLAISIYHSMDDFANIFHLINSMNASYKFYLNHFTIYHEETILFAI